MQNVSTYVGEDPGMSEFNRMLSDANANFRQGMTIGAQAAQAAQIKQDKMDAAAFDQLQGALKAQYALLGPNAFAPTWNDNGKEVANPYYNKSDGTGTGQMLAAAQKLYQKMNPQGDWNSYVQSFVSGAADETARRREAYDLDQMQRETAPAAAAAAPAQATPASSPAQAQPATAPAADPAATPVAESPTPASTIPPYHTPSSMDFSIPQGQAASPSPVSAATPQKSLYPEYAGKTLATLQTWLASANTIVHDPSRPAAERAEFAKSLARVKAEIAYRQGQAHNTIRARGTGVPQMTMQELSEYEKRSGDIHIPALIGVKEGVVNANAMAHGGKAIVNALNRKFPVFAAGTNVDVGTDTAAQAAADPSATPAGAPDAVSGAAPQTPSQSSAALADYLSKNEPPQLPFNPSVAARKAGDVAIVAAANGNMALAKKAALPLAKAAVASAQQNAVDPAHRDFDTYVASHLADTYAKATNEQLMAWGLTDVLEARQKQQQLNTEDAKVAAQNADLSARKDYYYAQADAAKAQAGVYAQDTLRIQAETALAEARADKIKILGLPQNLDDITNIVKALYTGKDSRDMYADYDKEDQDGLLHQYWKAVNVSLTNNPNAQAPKTLGSPKSPFARLWDSWMNRAVDSMTTSNQQIASGSTGQMGSSSTPATPAGAGAPASAAAPTAAAKPTTPGAKPGLPAGKSSDYYGVANSFLTK